jgi:hypothetical protein
VHAPIEDKDDIKHSFYKLEQIPYESFIMRFQCKVQREDIFKPVLDNEGLHEASIDNGVTVVNFSTSKNLSKAEHSHTPTFTNTLGLLLMASHIIR